MMTYIFIYNAVYIKSDFSKLCYSKNQKMVLIASEYCLTHLSPENRSCFDAVHELSTRDIHEINSREIEQIVLTYIKQGSPQSIRLLTNEDSAQLIIAKLRERYGISGPNADKMLPFVNKVVAKQRIGDAVRLPRFVSFDKEQYIESKEAYLNLLVEKIGFPMFAKPVDLAGGSIETSYISNVNKLRDVAERILEHRYEFEINEYIDGDIFHCDALIINQEIKFFVVGKYSSSPSRLLRSAPLGIMQVVDQDMVEIFKRPCAKVVERLDCPSGAYHIEAFLKKNTEEFVFLGIAARNGGHCIPKMCDRRFGINIEEMNYSIQMGLVDDLEVTTKKVFLGSVAFPKMPGKVVGVNRPDIDIRNEFVEYAKVGDVFPQVQNVFDMACGVVFWDESYQKIVETIESLKNYNPLEMFSELPTSQQADKISEILFKAMPFVFWKDIYGRYQGVNSRQIFAEDMVGKTIYGIIDDQEEARLIDENDARIMRENTPQVVEEKITLPGGQKIFYSQKSPIHDDNGNVIGLINCSVDVTEHRSREEGTNKVFKLLFDTMPFVFWKDTKGIYQGANSNKAISFGLNSPQDMIGKTVFEFTADKKAAEFIDENDNKIMNENVTRIVEEKIDDKVYYSQKTPIHDDRGNVSGLVGFSIDITELKQREAELTKKVNKAFQTVHDIRSPLASLSMIVESCKSIPESERIILREVAMSINDIANNLLNVYKKDKNLVEVKPQAPPRVLVSLALSEILSEKKYQYKNSAVKFNYSIEPNCNFVFVEANSSDFSRMISNVINNAVDALEETGGKVDLKLSIDRGRIKIIIQDSGKGMPQEIIDKIMHNVAVTSGKVNGHGIGLGQVQSALQASKGEMAIESKLGRGTEITLTFPVVESPGWIAERIEFHKDNTIVILDDDSSIHGAWRTRFKPYKADVQLLHFTSGEEVIHFISGSSSAEKNRIILLSDFELIDQKFNGLQVIKQLSMQQQAILVTNHHNNPSIRGLATEARVKILPKQLASDVPITVLPD